MGKEFWADPIVINGITVYYRKCNGKDFVEVEKAKCPVCGKEMIEYEDETVFRCDNDKCPVHAVQIEDYNGNPITKEGL